MKIEKLITDANKDLYAMVRSKYKIHLKRSDDSHWGVHIEKGIVIVSHSRTNHPIASFTHELLHIDTQINGYRRIGGGVSIDPETSSNLTSLCNCLDNELQHQKMYKRFESLGFAANEFYTDSDIKLAPFLERILNIPNLTLIELAIQFFSLIAPGGSIEQTTKNDLLERFYDYGGQKYKESFQKLEKIMDDWKNETTYDAAPYIKLIFKTLNAGPSWLTYRGIPTNFPDSGFFTGTEFAFTIVK